MEGFVSRLPDLSLLETVKGASAVLSIKKEVVSGPYRYIFYEDGSMKQIIDPQNIKPPPLEPANDEEGIEIELEEADDEWEKVPNDSLSSSKRDPCSLQERACPLCSLRSEQSLIYSSRINERAC